MQMRRLLAMLALCAGAFLTGQKQAAGYEFDIVDPPAGTQLERDAVEFNWTGNCPSYRLIIGTEKGGKDLHSGNWERDTSEVVFDLPWNGERVFARLFCGDEKTYKDYPYTAWFYDQITSPAPGSDLEDTIVVFQWTGDSAAYLYCVDLGSKLGGHDIDRNCTDGGTSIKFDTLPDDDSHVYARLWYQKTPTSCKMYADCPYTDVTDLSPYKPYIAHRPGWNKSDLRIAEVFLLDTPNVTTLDENPDNVVAVVQQGATLRAKVLVYIDNTHVPNGQMTLDPNDITVEVSFKNYDASGDYYFNPEYDAESVTMTFGPDEAYRNLIPLPTILMDPNRIQHIDEAGFSEDEEMDLQDFDYDDIAELTATDVLWTNDFSDLAAKDPERVTEMLTSQIPALRFLQEAYNNHANAVPEVYVRAVDNASRTNDYMLYDISLDSVPLKPGLWEMIVTLDVAGTILEFYEDNNVFEQQPLAEVVNSIRGMPAAMAALGNRDFYRRVNPCPTTTSLGEKWLTRLDRARYRDGWPHEHTDHSDYLNHFTNMTLREKRHTRISEIWGPNGQGRYYDGVGWVPYYDDEDEDDSNNHPQPSDIENIFFFTLGQHGCASSILTGIPEDGKDHNDDDVDCDFTGNHEDSRWIQLMPDSYPAHLLRREPVFDEGGENVYSRHNTLMVSVPEHHFVIWSPWPYEPQYASSRWRMSEDFLNYLAARTNAFENVKTIFLAGKSRGGHLVIWLTHRLKEMMETPDQHDPLPAWSSDVVTYTRTDLLYRAGENLASNDPIFVTVAIEPGGHPRGDFGNVGEDYQIVLDASGTMGEEEPVIITKLNFEWMFPYTTPVADNANHTRNLSLLNITGIGFRGTDLFLARAVLAWPCMAIDDGDLDPVAHPLEWKLADREEDALAGDFYTHWNMPGIAHMPLGSNWYQRNGPDVLDYFLRKAYDYHDYPKLETGVCVDCDRQTFSGNLRYGTGLRKRFSKNAQKWAQRFHASPMAGGSDGYLEYVTLGMHLPPGQRARVRIYSDTSDDPYDGALLATSDVLSYEHGRFDFNLRFTFPPSERTLLDSGEWYWLVVEFLDVDERTTEEVGELVYFDDPDHVEIVWALDMLRYKYDDTSGTWGWDNGPGVDVGVLKFSVENCKKEPFNCTSRATTAGYRYSDYGAVLNDDSPKKAQRFVATRSGAVPEVQLWLSNVEDGEEIEVCIYDDEPLTELDAPENRLGCTSRDDLEIGSSAEGVHFYFIYGDVPYVRSEEGYWLVVKRVGTAEAAVWVDETGTYESGTYAHYSVAEGGWIHHAGYQGDNQDMKFFVYSCDH